MTRWIVSEKSVRENAFAISLIDVFFKHSVIEELCSPKQFRSICLMSRLTAISDSRALSRSDSYLQTDIPYVLILLITIYLVCYLYKPKQLNRFWWAKMKLEGNKIAASFATSKNSVIYRIPRGPSRGQMLVYNNYYNLNFTKDISLLIFPIWK